MNMINIKATEGMIKQFGNELQDTFEMVGVGMTLINTQIAYLLNNVELNKKYEPELNDINEWFESHYPEYTDISHRRRQVYFNNSNYDERFQCISLFQIIDDGMFIYQRSSHTEKMLDDYRFFAEIVQRWFYHVTYIKIFYGSLHTQKTNND